MSEIWGVPRTLNLRAEAQEQKLGSRGLNVSEGYVMNLVGKRVCARILGSVRIHHKHKGSILS